MAGFTKLFSSIVTSSIWSEDDKTRIMWITMLASADARGHVDGAIPGMAAIARMSLLDAEQAIARLSAPDPYSRTADQEGRRIIAEPGGWRVVNYAAYREKRDPEKRREQNRDAKRRQRQTSAKCQPMSAISQPRSAQAEAEAEKSTKNPLLPPPSGSERVEGVEIDPNGYPHLGEEWLANHETPPEALAAMDRKYGPTKEAGDGQ